MKFYYTKVRWYHILENNANRNNYKFILNYENLQQKTAIKY